MKVLKIIISIIILLSVLAFDYYNKFYKENTNFDEEAIFLYVVEGDTLAFSDSISKYIKNEKTFYKAAQRLDYLDNIKTGRFKISKGIGNKELITSLKYANTPLTVTFNNQERVENLAGRLASQVYADSISLIRAFTDEKFLKENGFNKENIQKDTILETSNEITINNLHLKFFDEVEFEIDKNKKIMTFILQNKNSKVLIKSLDEITDWKFIIASLSDEILDSRSDENLLTGCLTFYETKLENIKIRSENAHCEDSVNFISSTGSINNIEINNATSDALDLDFSYLQILLGRVKVF